MSSCTNASGWLALTCAFDQFRYTNALFMSIFAVYFWFYFKRQVIWTWLMINCVCMFVGFEIYAAWEASGGAISTGIPLFTIASVFWAIGELGDVWLFYLRFLYTAADKVDSRIKSIFYLFFSTAVMVRIVDIVLKGLDVMPNGEKGTKFPLEYLVEPIYFSLIWITDVGLQYQYTVVARNNTRYAASLKWTLLRSSGARFCIITVPLLGRIIGQFITGDINSPNLLIPLNFSTAVNLFTMIDLLMLKYELMLEMISRDASSHQTRIADAQQRFDTNVTRQSITSQNEAEYMSRQRNTLSLWREAPTTLDRDSVAMSAQSPVKPARDTYVS